MKSFHKFITLNPKYQAGASRAKLVMLGSVRNEQDQERVDELHRLLEELNLVDRVEIHTNVGYATLTEFLGRSKIGIHTMSDEHFGISIIEYMAAGLIPVAHDSAGPKLDIIVPFKNQKTGILRLISVCLYGRKYDGGFWTLIYLKFIFK